MCKFDELNVNELCMLKFKFDEIFKIEDKFDESIELLLRAQCEILASIDRLNQQSKDAFSNPVL